MPPFRRYFDAAMPCPLLLFSPILSADVILLIFSLFVSCHDCCRHADAAPTLISAALMPRDMCAVRCAGSAMITAPRQARRASARCYAMLHYFHMPITPSLIRAPALLFVTRLLMPFRRCCRSMMMLARYYLFSLSHFHHFPFAIIIIDMRHAAIRRIADYAMPPSDALFLSFATLFAGIVRMGAALLLRLYFFFALFISPRFHAQMMLPADADDAAFAISPSDDAYRRHCSPSPSPFRHRHVSRRPSPRHATTPDAAIGRRHCRPSALYAFASSR